MDANPREILTCVRMTAFGEVLLPRLAAVFAVDPAHGARRGAHHHGFGGHRAVAAALDAFEQRAVGDSGGGEDHIALGEVVQAIDAVEVLDAPAAGAAALVVVAEQQPALELAADA